MKKLVAVIIFFWPLVLIVATFIWHPESGAASTFTTGVVLGASWAVLLYLYLTKHEEDPQDDGYDEYGVKTDDIP